MIEQPRLQLDNTCKQNKARFLMAFLGDLVSRGIFREIYVSFLPVGHTHEDIDQVRTDVVWHGTSKLCAEIAVVIVLIAFSATMSQCIHKGLRVHTVSFSLFHL
jgi:hypothetical protein